VIRGSNHDSLITNLGQAERVANQSLKGGLDGLRPDVWSHPRAKRRQLRFRLSPRRRHRVAIQLCGRRLHQPTIELHQAVENRRTGLPSRSLRLTRQAVNLREETLDMLLEDW
jgi:hypothetical protein